jgi:6-pyruvoyltetrahydropterin/6-carboxytetrahydropterin synthase
VTSTEPTIYLTHRYRFPAAHVLAQPGLGAEENDRIFGKCANPAGHGHDYSFEISVTGPRDPVTGEIIAPAQLDRIFDETIAARYSHRMLNDVRPFTTLVPTAENIAKVVHHELASAVAQQSTAQVARVMVIETPRNFAEHGEIR